MAGGIQTVLLAVLALVAVATYPAQPSSDPEEYAIGVHDWESAFSEGNSFHGAKITHSFPALRGFVVMAQQPNVWIQDVLADERVRYAEETGEYSLTESDYPNDAFFPTQYGPQNVKAPAAWNVGAKGDGSHELCMMDTGIRVSHEEFDINNSSRYAGGHDFYHDDPYPNDTNGHGSVNAGIATANTNNGVGIAGVAPNATYYIAQVAVTGSGETALVGGTEWCEERADIFAISIGGKTNHTLYYEAIDHAWAAGKLIVASAGNEGTPNVVLPQPCQDCILYPAKWPQVIAVTNVDILNDFYIGSSQGPEAELAAPGVDIIGPDRNSNSDYDIKTGTSESAPHVAGVAALLWNWEPTLPNTVIRDILVESATDLGDIGRDELYGFGLVNAEAGLQTMYPRGLPVCRFLSPTRFDQIAPVAPTLAGSVVFRSWSKSTDSSVSGVTLRFNSTDYTLSSTSDPRVHEVTINTASFADSQHTLTLTCTESDGSTRTHVRQYKTDN